ncbi:hypothetical protein C453_01175 [Haloferax elongans ATCC BAA-1513]|uniref:Type IV secretion system coupling protein TraD DNA-binding domain-containing protein n=1 Tax=Haloferax elongans ATCC BAA-1513 TaxID=1230453 RepID=M0HYQ5_HALEO|nr:hypothetical protein [Haloferax elongans]ELZ88832.1 hypothetical protein C453_01175 [Haloferax elongans ATCC BAA-1513]
MFDRFTNSNSNDSPDDADGTDERTELESDGPRDTAQDSTQESGPTSITGDPYQITDAKHTRVGGKAVATDTKSEGLVAGPYVREMFESGVTNPEKPLWIGYDDGAQTGFREAPIRFESQFRHLWISGTTGAGKTTALQNKAVQHAYAGHGFCNIDPKASGDTLELLQQLPKDRLDDVIFLEPGSAQWGRTIGINMLDVPETENDAELEREIESRLENLIAIFDNDEYWGVNMQAVTESMGRAMLRANAEADDPADKYSIIDMYFILLNAERREVFAEQVDDPYLSEFLHEIAKMEDDEIRPLTKRIKSWVENAVIRKIIARRESTVDWDNILDNDRILLIRIPVDNEDIHQMVTLTVLRNLWSAKKRQDRDPTRESNPFFVQLDEFEKVANDNLDIEGMLARARSMYMSVTLGTQYPGQIGDEFPDTLRAMENNCNTLLAMRTPGEQDARLLMKRFKGYSGEDLQSTNLYRAWTKIPLAGGRESEPVKIQTFAPYPPLRDEDDATDAIQRSLHRFGAEPLTDDEIQRELKYGEFNEVVTPDTIDGDGSIEADATSIPTDRILEGVFAAQIRPEIETDDEGYVAIADAKREIERRLGDTGYTSQLSNVIEQTLYDGQYAEVDRRSGQSVVKLTAAGRAELFGQDTGSSASGGSDDHRLILQKSYEAFTRLGYVTSLPTQVGDELADGIADLPIDPMDGNSLNEIESLRDELREEYPAVWALSEGRHVNIEAETSTIEKPKQTLSNLKKAVNNDRLCVFTLKDESATKGEFGYWGRRGEQVLYDSWREGNNTAIDYDRLTFARSVDDAGHRQFYNLASFFEFDDGVYALRPAYDADTERSVSVQWVETDDGVVCRDSTGGVHARFSALDEIKDPSTNAFPAYYEYDRSEQEFVVCADGEKHRYASTADLEADWKRVYAPFIPDHEFDRVPTDDDFVFVVFPDGDNSEFDEPQIYEQGTLRPLHPATDGSSSDVEEHEPARPQDDRAASGHSSSSPPDHNAPAETSSRDGKPTDAGAQHSTEDDSTDRTDDEEPRTLF